MGKARGFVLPGEIKALAFSFLSSLAILRVSSDV
jgi:hypothetical protein